MTGSVTGGMTGSSSTGEGFYSCTLLQRPRPLYRPPANPKFDLLLCLTCLLLRVGNILSKNCVFVQYLSRRHSYSFDYITSIDGECRARAVKCARSCAMCCGNFARSQDRYLSSASDHSTFTNLTLAKLSTRTVHSILSAFKINICTRLYSI